MKIYYYYYLLFDILWNISTIKFIVLGVVCLNPQLFLCMLAMLQTRRYTPGPDTSFALMFVQRLRRWPSIKPTLSERRVPAV